VEWLGEVPEHWEIQPLKIAALIQSGLTLGKNYLGRKLVEFPYLRVANVQDGYLSLSDIKTVFVPQGEAARSTLRTGDVLMTEGGDPDKLGRGCVWEGQIAPCLHQNHIFAVRPERDRLRPHFLAALLGSQYAKTYFLRTAKQTTNLASTNKTMIGQFLVLLPGLDEQSEVLAALEAETAQIDQAVSHAHREISLLREYRTRFIADVVTGKLDVREAAANLPEEAGEAEAPEEIKSLIEDDEAAEDADVAMTIDESPMPATDTASGVAGA
jgi:type I restriction enzyme S subunit